MSRGAVRAGLEAIFRSALQAVEPGVAVRRHVAVGARASLAIAGEALAPKARIFAIAAGKAAAPMARVFEEVVGARLAAGLAVVPDGYGRPLSRFVLHEAAHPVPDARGERAAREALRLAESAGPGDVLVVLLSGGASSLLALPAPGLDLADLAASARALLEAGAPIEELNAVRKHLSAIAGGQLALRAAAERVEVLAISDVPGDRLDVIGSGPCVGDPSSYRDALDAVAQRGAEISAGARAHLEAGARGERPETPDPDHPRLRRVRHTLVAANATALEGARRAARSLGWRAVVLGSGLHGEAALVGARLAALARGVRAARPVCLLAGGETVVTVRGSGRGGRSQELALAAAIGLEGTAGVVLLAAGTDGRDGPTDAAGAFADGGSVARGRARGVDAQVALAANDSHAFFVAEGGVFRTGPTLTNVMDLALVHVGAEPVP